MNRITNFFLCCMVATVATHCLIGCRESETSQFEKLRARQQQQDMASLQKGKTFEQQLKGAREELDRGSAQQAIEITLPLLVKFPEHPELLFLTAEAKATLGDKVAAAELLASISNNGSEVGSDNAKRAAMQAASWLVEVGRLELAIDHLLAHLATTPNHHRSRHRLVSLLNNSGRRVEAAEQLQFLLRHSDVSEKELFSMTTLSHAFIDESIPPPSLDSTNPATLAMARRLRDQGDLDQALRVMQPLTASFPNSTPIAAFFGKLLAELNQFERFGEWTTTLPQGVDREPEYWHALGRLSLHRQDHPAAVRCFGETLQRDPTDRIAVLELARALKHLNENQHVEFLLEQFRRLEETESLAKTFGISKGTAQQYKRMAERLDELGRPWEAIGWRVVGMDQTVDGENQRTEIESRRRNLLQEDSLTTAGLALNGLDLSQWPLPATGADKANTRVQDRISLASPANPIRLEDVAQHVGLNFQYLNGDDTSDKQYFLHQQTGGGIGIIDLDLDGWSDIYFTQAGGPVLDSTGSKPHQMYRNLAGKEFAVVTLESGCGDTGYGQGAAVADLNQDGFPDLLVANIGVNSLLMNNGDGSFSRRALPVDGDSQWTTSIACGDINGDHLPEIVEVNYIDDATAFEIACVPENDACGPSRFQPALDRWLSVDPHGRILPLNGLSSTESQPGHGFAVLITNMDNQAGNDVYIANDGDPNHYWLSRTAPGSVSRLEEAGYLSGCATSQLGGRHGSMGLASGDFDRNGQLDLYITNYWDQEADLYLQQSGGVFRHASRAWQMREPTKPTVGWGTQAADLNRDGWLDLLVLNGHIVDHSHRGIPFRMLPQLFEGRPDHFHLVPETESSSSPNSFFSKRALARTLAQLDWNRDGRPDFVANYLDQPVSLLENRTDIQNWVQFQLVGTTSERDAIGTTIQVSTGEDRWTGWVVGGGGFLCSNEAVVDFGLGLHDEVSEISVLWPSGARQTIQNLPANHRYLIIEGQLHAFAQSSR